MKVTVEFLSLPIVAKIVGSKTITLDFSGSTVVDLLHELARKYGAVVQKFLFDEAGQFDMSLALTVNREWVRQNQMDKALHEGDRVIIMMLVAGG
jgi:molybdopterin converting factor small subunit